MHAFCGSSVGEEGHGAPRTCETGEPPAANVEINEELKQALTNMPMPDLGADATQNYEEGDQLAEAAEHTAKAQGILEVMERCRLLTMYMHTYFTHIM